MYEETVQHTNAGTTRSADPGDFGLTATGLGKQFGDMWALRDLDLAVPTGTVLGLLGHNGAGKTTAIRILTTLSAPTTGSATVAGIDVARDPAGVRRRIGVASQQATVDGLLDAHANLVMIGRLYHLSKADARRRADELLERLELTDASDRLVKTFSGGMRRRLDLAASIVARPQVLFLDEPTTGLDPKSRNDLWEMLRNLVSEGTTILLTTQYLDEADQLADDVIVLDHGKTVAHGSPAELKSQIGEERVDITVTQASDLERAAAATTPVASGAPTFDERTLTVTVPLKPGVRLLEVMRSLDDESIDALDLNRRQATLDDVFLTLTGSKGRDDDDDASDSPTPTTSGSASKNEVPA